MRLACDARHQASASTGRRSVDFTGVARAVCLLRSLGVQAATSVADAGLAVTAPMIVHLLQLSVLELAWVRPSTGRVQ